MAGALVLLAKKFGIVALAALGAAFAWLKRWISRRQDMTGSEYPTRGTDPASSQSPLIV